MAFTLKIEASLYEGGPVKSVEIPNFPVNLKEASEKFGEDAVYAGFVRTYTIAVQSKIRAQHKAPTTGRTKRGSALAQVQAARMKAASEAAVETVQ